MEQQDVITTLNKLKEVSPKRNFKQAVDLIISLKSLDLKKPENQVDLYVNLHYPRGRKAKICAFVAAELAEQAKQVCDMVILLDDFPRWAADKKKLKKLARSFDFFIAQANIMPKVAQVFGKYLGVMGKMPNPKAGCVVPPNANLKVVYEKLQKTVRVQAKTQLTIQTMVGKEDSPEAEIVDNIMSIFTNVLHHIPNENNLKAVYLKFTMGPPLKVGAKEVSAEDDKKKKSKKALAPKAAEAKNKGAEGKKAEQPAEEKKEEEQKGKAGKEEKPKSSKSKSKKESKEQE